jgi:hypothetical protein
LQREGTVKEGDVSAKASVDVSCKKCYIKGHAYANITIESTKDDSEILQIVNKTRNEFTSQIKDLTEDYIDQIRSFVDDNLNSTTNFVKYVSGVYNEFDDGIDIADFLPHMNQSAIPSELTLTPIPDTNLTFRFEGLDLYLELETILGASTTYTLPLCRSKTAYGFSFNNDLKIGATFTVDLILTVEGSLDMTSGLHVKIDDAVTLDIALFGDEISGIDL